MQATVVGVLQPQAVRYPWAWSVRGAELRFVLVFGVAFLGVGFVGGFFVCHIL